VAASDYYFETHWRVHGSVEEVRAVLGNALYLPKWWPDVYLSVREAEPGVFALHTKGRLPYTLRWSFRVVPPERPDGYTIRAWGDLEGTGVWTFRRDGDSTRIVYQWTVRASKPILRYFSFLLKPMFAANHRWAMARGEESLVRELERRRTISF